MSSSIRLFAAAALAERVVEIWLEFRRAHEVVGRCVAYAIERGKALEQLSLDELKPFSPLFEDSLYEALTLESSLANKPALGGTSPERVGQALAKAKAALDSAKSS